MSFIKKVLFFSLLISSASFAQPYQPGEKMVYSVQWKYGLLLVTAGYLTSVIQAPVQDKNGNVVYPIVGSAKSAGATGAFYPFSYILKSSFDRQTLSSRSFEMSGKEKSDRKDQIQTHNYSGGEIAFWQKTFDEKKKDEAPKIRDEKRPLSQPTQDVMSVLYSLRTAPLPQAAQEYRFNAAWEGEIYNVIVHAKGTERIKFDGNKIDTDVYVLDFYLNGKLDNGGTKIWVSRDARRVVLKLESEVKVGKIWVKLDSIN